MKMHVENENNIGRGHFSERIFLCAPCPYTANHDNDKLVRQSVSESVR